MGVLVVGLGEVDKARRFAELLGFPLDILYAGTWGVEGEVRRLVLCR